jgi:WD40 repeat protein
MNNTHQVLLYAVEGRHAVQRWLTGHRVELRGVAAHPRLERLVTSGYLELCSWDISVARPSPVMLEPNPGAVTALAYSPDGSRLATASWRVAAPREVFVRISDASTGKPQTQITVPNIVNTLAFDPTGEQFAYGDAAGKVVVCDCATGRPVREFATGSSVHSIVFLDRPRALVVHGKDSVFFFNAETGKQEKKVDLAGGPIRRMAADRARGRLVVGFQSGALASLSLPDLVPGPSLEKSSDGSVECLALSPDGRLLATGSDHRVMLRDAQTFEVLLAFPLWTGALRELTFDSTGHRLAVVGTDSDVDLWDLAALRDGLTPLGLAWDRPAPAVAPTSVLAPEGTSPRPLVPVIRRPAK